MENNKPTDKMSQRHQATTVVNTMDDDGSSVLEWCEFCAEATIHVEDDCILCKAQMNSRPVEMFSRLREAWFNRVIRQPPPERVWEEGGEERARKRRNAFLKSIYDEHTHRILAGENLPIAPTASELYQYIAGYNG